MIRPHTRLTRPAALLLAAATALIAPGVAPARPHLHAPAIDAQPVVLPDTPAARVARGFLDMLSDGTEKAVAGFEGAHASASRRGSVEIPERVRRVANMKQEWGPLTVERVIASTDGNIILAVRSAQGGELLHMDFQLSPTEPGKLDVIMIESGGAGPAEKPESVTPAQVAEVVEAASRTLESTYVFPEVALKMGESLRAKLKAGEYDSVKDEMDLARRLTGDLRAVSKDKHLRVNFSPKREEKADAHMGSDADHARRENYAFRKVEILPGNIGYLRFDAFFESDEAYRVASGAMNFLANADAIIFDLRHNGGGSPEMIRYITSYLFETPTHLNDMIDREGNTVQEFWTLEDVPGKRPRADIPLFVLTSSRTFSGAEEFSYNLKNLKRAAIIGETTGGGAHPVMGERLNDRFTIGVPFMRANNPISKTNWEGTGVKPDIKTTAAEALDRATAEARKAIDERQSAHEAR